METMIIFLEIQITPTIIFSIQISQNITLWVEIKTICPILFRSRNNSNPVLNLINLEIHRTLFQNNNTNPIHNHINLAIYRTHFQTNNTNTILNHINLEMYLLLLFNKMMTGNKT